MRLRTFAHVLDFFGAQFEIRNGNAVVPGGQRSAAAWAELAGASPDKGAAFFEKLMVKDDGWLASLYDALARIHGPVQDLPDRTRPHEALLRGGPRQGHQPRSGAPGVPLQRRHDAADHAPAHRPQRPAAHSRQPGGLEESVRQSSAGQVRWQADQAAAGWKEPDDVLEALFGLSRKAVENEPLKIFMALSDLDRERATPLTAATVDRLARNYQGTGRAVQPLQRRARA